MGDILEREFGLTCAEPRSIFPRKLPREDFILLCRSFLADGLIGGFGLPRAELRSASAGELLLSVSLLGAIGLLPKADSSAFLRQ